MSLQELFSEVKITRADDHEEIYQLGPQYIRGYSGSTEELMLDGEFTAAQLRALADWMDQKQ